MKLTTVETELLNGIRRELSRLRAWQSEGGYTRDPWEIARRERAALARDGIVVFDLSALIGHGLDGAQQRNYQRAAARLEALGLVERLKDGPDGARTTHLRLLAEAAEA